MLLLLLQSATQQLSQTRTKASHTLPCALLVRSSTLSLLQQTSADPCASHPSTPLLSISTAPPEERKKERIRKEARLCSTDRVYDLPRRVSVWMKGKIYSKKSEGQVK